jgi:hypothetical protein
VKKYLFELVGDVIFFLVVIACFLSFLSIIALYRHDSLSFSFYGDGEAAAGVYGLELDDQSLVIRAGQPGDVYRIEPDGTIN